MALPWMDYSSEAQRKRALKHGGVLNNQKTPEYSAWSNMRQRCLNPGDLRYSSYGGRGIAICEEWSSFENFLRDMGPRPSPRHSLERIDNDKGYSKQNCVWDTAKGQMRNRRVSRYVEGGVPLAELAEKHGIPANTLRWRIIKGWTLDDALSNPVRPKRKNAEPILPE